MLFDVLNAADYGMPQKRQRVFFIGFRSDVGVRWSFPDPTHSEDALPVSKWVDATYWDEHGISRNRRPEVSLRYAKRVGLLGSTPY